MRQTASFAILAALAAAGAACAASDPRAAAAAVEEKSLFVGPVLRDCTGVAPTKCLQVKDTADAPWRLFHGGIEGFTHESGFEYELRVRVTPVASPPADAPNVRYSLIAVLRRSAIPASAAASSLQGPTWRLVALSGKDESALAAAPRGVTARFTSGRVEGFSGCNSYGGGYTIEGDRVTLGPLAGTMMACPEPAMSLENAFKAAFAGTIRFAIAEDRLTVMTESGGTMLFRAESPATLEGVTWEVTGFNNGRQAVVSPILGTAITLSFRDGIALGHSGCNTYRTGYTRDGNRLTIGAAAATRKACAAEGVMEQEQQFLAALQSATTWTIRGDVLDLQRADGARALTARRGQAQ